ncbi:MAG TPA: hypothetical protein VNE62_06675 [Actinomycetota bacterium]|nr:hypothetical protein [Actinomycetota bacterium]
MDDRKGQPGLNGATVTIADGSYREVVTVGDSGEPRIHVSGGSSTQLKPVVREGLTVGGANERPGRYLVTVTKPGYREWSRRVVVKEEPSGCHVETRELEVRLEPLP